MKVLTRPMLALAAVFAGCVPAPCSRGEARVLCHYMPWFKAERLPNGEIEWDHWQWFGKGPKHDPDDILGNGRRDIASVHYPLIGPYDGRDPAVLEYHMLTAKAAGIEGFVADWYGPGNLTDEIFAEMVKAAERSGMKVAICLEEKSFFPPYTGAQTRAEAQDAMERQIRHVLHTHGTSPAYLRRQGKAVFFVFTGYEDTPIGRNVLSPGELADVLGRFDEGEILYVRGHIDPQYVGVAPGSYAWCGDKKYRDPYYASAGAARVEGKFEFWAGMAYPGFDDSGVHGWGRGVRIDERRGTQLYDETWEDILRHDPDAVQLVTWNDFQEGTTIEPTEEYGFTFMDKTEEYVGKWTGRRVNTGDNRWPYRVYQLRHSLASLPDPEARAQWAGKLDAFSSAFAGGRRFLMGWRLRRLESQIGRLVNEK